MVKTPNKNEEQNAEEELKKQLGDQVQLKDKTDNRRELNVIKSRILQQFVSPTTGLKGIVSKEEERMIEDQAKMMLRRNRRARETKGE